MLSINDFEESLRYYQPEVEEGQSSETRGRTVRIRVRFEVLAKFVDSLTNEEILEHFGGIAISTDSHRRYSVT